MLKVERLRPVLERSENSISGVEAASLDKGLEPGVIEVRTRSGLVRVTELVCEYAVVIAIIGEFVVLFGNVVVRTAFNSSWVWALEPSEVALTIIAFVGGALAYLRGQQPAMTALVSRLPMLWRDSCAAISDIVVAVTALTVAVLSVSEVPTTMAQGSLLLKIPVGINFAILAFGLFACVLFAVDNLIHRPRKAALVAVGISVVALPFFLWAAPWVVYLAGPLWLIAGVFLFLIALGIPITFALLGASLLYQIDGGWFTALTVVLNVQAGTANFLYLAIPFFVMAGGLLTQAGLARPLGSLATLLLGRLRGGTAHAIVGAMYVFSGISGSKLADIAGVGAAMSDIVRREGVPSRQVAALLSASAVMGETVPPSIGILILAPLVSLSVGTLFLAGVVPAAVVAIALMAVIFIRGRSAPIHGPRLLSRAAGGILLGAAPSLLIPVVLVVGMVSGTGTPTEVSSFAVLLAFVMMVIVNKRLDLRATGRILSYTGSMSGMVLILIAAAASFSFSLTLANAPQDLGMAVSKISDPRIYMLATIAAMIVMGGLLEGLAAVIVLAPLMLPAAALLGIDPIHYAIVLLIAMALGAFAPPIGAGFYMASVVAGAKVDEAMRPTLFYMLIVLVALVVIALVPGISLALPHAFQR
jgi:tripartite ATP-independent transporter DctM subunit